MKFGSNPHETLLSVKITYISMGDNCLLIKMDAKKGHKFS